MVEALPVHEPDGSHALGVLTLLVGGDDRHGSPTGVRDQLHRERAETAGASPDQYWVAFLDGVRRPAVEHAVGRAAGERRRRGLLPGEVLGLWHALMVLHLRELRHRAPTCVVAPHAEGRREPWVLARGDPGIVEIPLPRMHRDVIADLHAGHLGTGRVDDPARVGTDDVEVGRLAPSRLGLRDVDRYTAGCPHII